jgi:hypothetical protein
VWRCGAGRQARLSADAPSEISPKRWRLDINLNFSQDAVLMLSSMNLPDGIQPINDMDFIRQSKVDVTTWSQAIATYDVPHP